MDVIKAKVQAVDGMYAIEMALEGSNASIPLSEDKPIEVKAAFNKLIVRLKSGLFRVELEECGDDLFSQVAKEYLEQLNKEIQEVYGEMMSHGLVSV